MKEGNELVSEPRQEAVRRVPPSFPTQSCGLQGYMLLTCHDPANKVVRLKIYPDPPLSSGFLPGPPLAGPNQKQRAKEPISIISTRAASRERAQW